LTVLLVLGLAAPVVASPASVSGCPPCDEGFVHAAHSHGLDTEVQQSAATVRVQRNGSATWTVRVVPTNDSVLARLAGNRSLARAVTEDSYGTRYGGGIRHEFIEAKVADGAFVMRYRTKDVVEGGPFGTTVLTYFRDSPGAWVYTDLGADELTVVAPEGMTVAQGFGTVSTDRMTATELPDARNGPFVIFAPAENPFPGIVGTLAVIHALAGVIVRNLVFFVGLPGAVIIGGFAGLRRWSSPAKEWKTTRIGGLVAAGGVLVVTGALVVKGDALPMLTGNLLLGLFVGTLLLILGGVVAIKRVRTHLTGPRIFGFGLVVGGIAHLVTKVVVGAGGVGGTARQDPRDRGGRGEERSAIDAFGHDTGSDPENLSNRGAKPRLFRAVLVPGAIASRSPPLDAAAIGRQPPVGHRSTAGPSRCQSGVVSLYRPGDPDLAFTTGGSRYGDTGRNTLAPPTITPGSRGSSRAGS